MNTLNNYKKKHSQMGSLQALVTILLAVVIILLSINVLNSNSSQLVSATQDAACRTFLQSYDTLAGRGEATRERFSAESSFFGELVNFCRTELLIFESRDKEDVFNLYSQAARRCYERYGSGNLNFLDFTQRKGAYCFVCAEVEFENVEDGEFQSYSYEELGKWMEEEIPENRNINRENYRDLSNLLYVSLLEGADIRLVRDQIQSQSSEFTGESRLAFISLQAQFDYLNSIYTRELPIQEKSYVVYKYENDDLYNPLVGAMVSTGLASRAVRQGAMSYVKKRSKCFGLAGAVASTGLVTVGAGTVAGAGIAGICAITTVVEIGVAGAVVYDAMNDQNTLSSLATDMISVFKLPGAQGEISQENEELLYRFSQLAQEGIRVRAQDLQDIPVSIVNALPDDERITYDSILRSESVNSNKEKELIGRLLIIQSERIFNNLETASWDQYVEILPQAEFYNQCGPVPNS